MVWVEGATWVPIVVIAVVCTIVLVGFEFWPDHRDRSQREVDDLVREDRRREMDW